ncbi:hypothetical protein [Streptomyces sp. H39-C1]|uniref:hypothetical protein n=1 Tax=Streptomyces sp. H39-C1 TaxID=3004355 RepID=UPI0022B04020|nr:hypothetical protein [Streptomyces sp. H39-C1]MCZ4102662.1 hypothetical protein [Streptomyces sp. H39-C1]
MRSVSFRPSDPASGYHRITCERRFRYLEQDPAHTYRIQWLPVPVACLICQSDTHLTFTLDEAADPLVRVACPAGHAFDEPRIDRQHFITYSRLLSYADPNPALLWITDAGFGQEDPPPIDYAHDIAAGARYVSRQVKRRAKAKVKAAIRRPLRTAKKKARNAAFTPVAAALRTAWAWQSGASPAPTPKAAPATATAAAPAKASRTTTCAVCQGAGQIPGTTVNCTECAPSAKPRKPRCAGGCRGGWHTLDSRLHEQRVPCSVCNPGGAATPVAPTDRRGAKATKPRRGNPAKVQNYGIAVVGDGQSITGSVINHPTTPHDDEIRRQVAASADRGTQPGSTAHTGVTSAGRTTGRVQSTVRIHGANNSVVNNTISGDAAPTTSD